MLRQIDPFWILEKKMWKKNVALWTYLNSIEKYVIGLKKKKNPRTHHTPRPRVENLLDQLYLHFQYEIHSVYAKQLEEHVDLNKK